MECTVKIPYDDTCFVNKLSENGGFWAIKYFYGQGAQGRLRYGLVQGYIAGKLILLTLYIFGSREQHRCLESEKWFKADDDNYIGDNKESGLWLHTGRDQISIVMTHLENLVDQALVGDLSVILSIHWWYVHLAPTCRGSSGIADMITNTLCRLHDLDLPPWKDGVAPSVETLLEPNEEKYSARCHELFAQDQEYLKMRFKKTELDG